MEQREIILRQQLGKHGYKLKGVNERFFVKDIIDDRLVILGNERHFVTVPFSVIFFVASVSRSDKARTSTAPRQNAALLPSDHASL